MSLSQGPWTFRDVIVHLYIFLSDMALSDVFFFTDISEMLSIFCRSFVMLQL